MSQSNAFSWLRQASLLPAKPTSAAIACASARSSSCAAKVDFLSQPPPGEADLKAAQAELLALRLRHDESKREWREQKAALRYLASERSARVGELEAELAAKKQCLEAMALAPAAVAPAALAPAAVAPAALAPAAVAPAPSAAKYEEEAVPRGQFAGPEVSLDPVAPCAAARLSAEHTAQRVARCEAQLDLCAHNEPGELGDASSGELVAQHVGSAVLVVLQLTTASFSWAGSAGSWLCHTLATSI